MLKGKKILIGISGSIAAYKIIHLTRLLIKEKAEVKIVMTKAAAQFVSPLVLSTLSGNKVLTDFFEEGVWANHAMLGRWADIMLIAPLSCNTLAKMANGICDNLLQSVYLSAACKVICAPAMDEDMWHHPATQKNIGTIQRNGNIVLRVASGELASGLNGYGRMQEPEEILLEIKSLFRKNILQGKKVLITSGPTCEEIDPVRFISNHSSGKMGKALAEVFYENGADVVFITGTSDQIPVYKNIEIIKIISAAEMENACLQHFPECHIAVMAAAVADYTPAEKAPQKIKKSDEELIVKLKKTTDILKELGKIKTSQTLIGFALETDNELNNAKEKLAKKNADFIVLNSMQSSGAGFGTDTNKVIILNKNGNIVESELLSKYDIAQFILSNTVQ